MTMRHAPFLIACLGLLSAGPTLAARMQDGSGMGMEGSDFGSRSGPGGISAQNVGECIDREVQRYNDAQAKFALQSIPEAATPMEAIQELIAQARQALANGNLQLANGLCFQLDTRISDVSQLGSRKSLDRVRSGEGGFDTSRMRQDQQNYAEAAVQRVAERLDYLTQRLESGKNPQSVVLVDKVKALLEAARREIQMGRFQNVQPLLNQAEGLCAQLQRLLEANVATDQHGVTGPSRDPFKDQQPAAQAALGQAEDIYQRVYNSAVRLGERPAPAADPKAASLRTRVFDLLEKAKEALSTSQPEAAKTYCLKAEGLLAEWHRSLSAADNKMSPAARERVKAKLDRAADLVSASGNDKAAKILDKAREHFERAERVQSEGQASRAEVEMDLALKLAAKAVDIARSGSP
jgi:hypothetical protein